MVAAGKGLVLVPESLRQRSMSLIPFLHDVESLLLAALI